MEPKKRNLYSQMEKKALEEQGLNSENTIFPSFLDSTPSFLNFCQLPEIPLEPPKKPSDLQGSNSINGKSQTSLKKENEGLPMSFLDDNQDFLAYLSHSTQVNQVPPKDNTKENSHTKDNIKAHTKNNHTRDNRSPNTHSKDYRPKDNHTKHHPNESGILKVNPPPVHHIKTGNKGEDDSDYIRTPLAKKISPPIDSSSLIPARSTIPKNLIVLVYCVLDTNIYIHYLPYVKQIINDSSIRIVVPLVVTRELDGLKKHQVHSGIAQQANQLLLNYKNKVIGQLAHETASQEVPNTPDEAIIWCASYFQKKVCENTILVSNDKNLQVHAIYHFGLSSMSIKEFIADNVKKIKFELGAAH